jgi:hypothetical protein
LLSHLHVTKAELEEKSNHLDDHKRNVYVLRQSMSEQAQEVHAMLRRQLAAASKQAEGIAILYGGSMNASNAVSLLSQPDINGGLVGGAEGPR